VRSSRLSATRQQRGAHDGRRHEATPAWLSPGTRGRGRHGFRARERRGRCERIQELLDRGSGSAAHAAAGRWLFGGTPHRIPTMSPASQTPALPEALARLQAAITDRYLIGRELDRGGLRRRGISHTIAIAGRALP
jgi:hypothetical protein